MRRYKRTVSPRKVSFDHLIRLHRLVFKQALRLSQLERQVNSLQHDLNDVVVARYKISLKGEVS
mgnify:CR=1 FL=1